MGFVSFDKLLLDGTDGSATDAGDNLILNGTDATSANADSSILFDDATGDPNFVSSGASVLFYKLCMFFITMKKLLLDDKC